jgi:hypothetical protein
LTIDEEDIEFDALMDEFRTYYTYYIQKHPGLDDESLFSSLHGHNEATVSKPEQSKLYKDRKCPCGFRKTQHKAWSCWLIDKDEPKRPDSFKIPKERQDRIDEALKDRPYRKWLMKRIVKHNFAAAASTFDIGKWVI